MSLLDFFVMKSQSANFQESSVFQKKGVRGYFQMGLMEQLRIMGTIF